MRYQQNLEKFKVRVVVLFSFNKRLKNLISKIGEIEAKIEEAPEFDKIIEVDVRRK